MSAPAQSERTALYRLFDADDRLLYVGITGNPKRRWQQHALYSDEWWPQVASKTVAWLDSRSEAEAAEKRVIQTEGPLYNRAYVPSPFTLREGQTVRDSSAIHKLNQRRSQSLYIQREETHGLLYEMILNALIDDIEAGRLRPDGCFPTRNDLRKRFGTSTGPIIQATRILRDEGAIRRRGKGYAVAEIANPR